MQGDCCGHRYFDGYKWIDLRKIKCERVRAVELCSLCPVNKATQNHHLVPIQVRKKGEKSPKARMCMNCHRFIHKAFTNEELGFQLNTVEKLKSHPLVQQFIELVEARIPFSIHKLEIRGNQLICRRHGMIVFEGVVLKEMDWMFP